MVGKVRNRGGSNSSLPFPPSLAVSFCPPTTAPSAGAPPGAPGPLPLFLCLPSLLFSPGFCAPVTVLGNSNVTKTQVLALKMWCKLNKAQAELKFKEICMM